jgi:hypothetical protein
MRIKTVIGVLVGLLLIGLLLGLGVYAYNNVVISGATPDQSQSPDTAAAATINTFSVQKPDFVVNGSELSKVEIWAVPTGSGVTESNYELLGSATLQSDSDPTAQVWTLPIPAAPVLATAIFAKGFDANGAAAANLSLPYNGATEIYDAVWGIPSTATSSKMSPNMAPATTTTTQRDFLFTLGVGQKASAGPLTLKLLQITSDSRCPQAAVCIWAGEVTAQVELISGTKDQKTDLHSSGQPYVFAGYNVSIAGVGPARRNGPPPAQGTYQIEFSVQKI